MALTPKIYNAAQKIIKAIYHGKPNLLTSVDLNRHFDILKESADRLWKLSGTEYNSMFTNNSSYDAANKKTLNLSITWTPFTVFVKAMQFSFPAGSFTAAITMANDYPSIRLYIVAKPVLVTFTDDAIMSGVSSPSLPSALASADHMVYKNERLAYAAYPNLPVLATGEEIVSKIATVIPGLPNPVTGISAPVLYSLTNSAYADKLKTLIGDKFGNDVSLVELNQYVLDYFFDYIKEPIGVWKGYVGNLTGAFDSTGLGIGKFIGWALMNGNNGTMDWRGRSPIGYDERNTDPGNTIWDVSYNQIGNVLGEKGHKITAQELPKHTHPILGIKGGDNGDHNNTIRLAGGDKNQGETGFYFTVDTGITGGDASHNTVHPVAVSCYIQRIS